MIVDSHCHLDRLDLEPFNGDLQGALDAAEAYDVSHILCVAITLENTPDVIAVADKYPQVSASVGLHPNEIVDQEPSVNDYMQFMENKNVVAVGETGLDTFRSEGDLSWQQDRFRRQIGIARDVKKPLIIHTRDAKDDTLKIMKQEKASEAGGVMHCFTGDIEMAKAAIDMGFYISFSGIITFKSAKQLQEVARAVPLENMLIETDAPYLAPDPNRGKSNQPAWVKYVALKVAELHNVAYEEVAKTTTENFFKCFSGARA